MTGSDLPTAPDRPPAANGPGAAGGPDVAGSPGVPANHVAPHLHADPAAGAWGGAIPAAPVVGTTFEGRKLAPQVLTLWLISGLIFLLILVPLALIIDLVGLRRLDMGWLRLLFYLATLVVGGLPLVYAPFRYRRWSYSIRDRDVLIESGVIWRVRRSIPRSRVQHVDISSGPIARAMGVVQVDLYTAGSIGAVASIPGLAPPDAEGLRQALVTDAQDGV